jgi:hypothetical protein
MCVCAKQYNLHFMMRGKVHLCVTLKLGNILRIFEGKRLCEYGNTHIPTFGFFIFCAFPGDLFPKPQSFSLRKGRQEGDLRSRMKGIKIELPDYVCGALKQGGLREGSFTPSHHNVQRSKALFYDVGAMAGRQYRYIVGHIRLKIMECRK